MKTWRVWFGMLAAVVLGLLVLDRFGPAPAQQREKAAEDVAPAGPLGKYRIHEARLSNREEYTLLLDTTTGRTWVLGLSRDGARLAWFDMGPPPLDKVAEKK